METLGIMMGFGMKTGDDYLRDGTSKTLPSNNVKCEDPIANRETLDCLLQLYGEHSERERLIVSPTGSKMQTVAVGIFSAFLDDVQIVYPTPREFQAPESYTRGVRQMYTFRFPELAKK